MKTFEVGSNYLHYIIYIPDNVFRYYLHPIFRKPYNVIGLKIGKWSVNNWKYRQIFYSNYISRKSGKSPFHVWQTSLFTHFLPKKRDIPKSKYLNVEDKMQEKSFGRNGFPISAQKVLSKYSGSKSSFFFFKLFSHLLLSKRHPFRRSKQKKIGKVDNKDPPDIEPTPEQMSFLLLGLLLG